MQTGRQGHLIAVIPAPVRHLDKGHTLNRGGHTGRFIIKVGIQFNRHLIRPPGQGFGDHRRRPVCLDGSQVGSHKAAVRSADQRELHLTGQRDITQTAVGRLRQQGLQGQRDIITGLGNARVREGRVLLGNSQRVAPTGSRVVNVLGKVRRDRVYTVSKLDRVIHLGNAIRPSDGRCCPGAHREGDRLAGHRSARVGQRRTQQRYVAVLPAVRVDRQRSRCLHRRNYGVSLVVVVAHQADGDTVGLTRQVDAVDTGQATCQDIGLLGIHQGSAQRPHLKPDLAAQCDVARPGIALLCYCGAQGQSAATGGGCAGVGQIGTLMRHGQGPIRCVRCIVSITDEAHGDGVSADLKICRIAHRHVTTAVGAAAARRSAIDREGDQLAGGRRAEAGLQCGKITVLHARICGGQRNGCLYLG